MEATSMKIISQTKAVATLTDEERKLVYLISKIAVSNTLKKAYEAKNCHTLPENIGR